MSKENYQVICIGDGREGSGCGSTTGSSGGTCKTCGGMLLSQQALNAANELAKIWSKEK